VLTITRIKPVRKQYGLRSGMQSRGTRLLSLLSLAVIGLIGSATVKASTIDVSTLLTNSTFVGNQAPTGGATVGCPIGWTCSTSGLQPGGTAYQPNEGPPDNPVIDSPSCAACSGGADISTQFVAGSDGLNTLGSTYITPNGALGTWAAQVPDHESNGSIMQTDIGTYDGTDSYEVDLWVGTPLTIFDLQQGPLPLTNPAAGATTGPIEAYFLGTGGAVLDEINVTAEATPGQWYNDPLVFTPTGAEIGQQIGFELSVGQGPNNEVADFAITPVVPTTPPPPIPEPGTFLLIGMGMVSLAYAFRRKSVRNS